MEFWTAFLVLLGVTDPDQTARSAPDPITVVETVAHHEAVKITSGIEPETVAPPPIVIDIKYTAGQRCWIAQGTQLIQRNLTLPYHQQTVYGTAQCQSDK